jgi:hypothetical protein
LAGTGGHQLPELTQVGNALAWRIARNQRGVDGADGHAGHPVQVVVPFQQRLVDTGLVGAQRTPALEHQGLGGRSHRGGMGAGLALRVDCHGSARIVAALGHACASNTFHLQSEPPSR